MRVHGNYGLKNKSCLTINFFIFVFDNGIPSNLLVKMSMRIILSHVELFFKLKHCTKNVEHW